MDAPVVPSAPAPPAPSTPPPAVSAERIALDNGSFSDFQAAKDAERAGKPLAAVETKPAPPKPDAPLAQKGPSAKDLAADERLRARVQEAVQQRETELRAEAARTEQELRSEAARTEQELRSKLAQYEKPADVPKAPAPTGPAFTFDTIEQWAEKPENAGKSLTDYMNAFADARETFVESRRTAQGREQAQISELHQQISQYETRMKAAVSADPGLKDKIAPTLRTAHPLSAYPKDAQGTPLDPATGKPAAVTLANVIAEVAFHSDNPAALYVHLTAHQDEATAIANLPPSQWMRALTRLDGKLSAAAGPHDSTPAPGPDADDATPAPPTPSPISNAPPPAPTLGKPTGTVDPKAAALKRGDFASYSAIRQQERLAERKAGAA